MVLGKERIASQASLSRLWDRIRETTFAQFQNLNQVMIDKVRLNRNSTELIIDLDFTHSDTFSHQEETNYNARYRTNSYHPLIPFDGVKDFLKPMLEHYSQTVPHTDILVRGDSGFATPDIYDTCESHQSSYVIRLKANTKLTQLAESFLLIGDDHPWDQKEVHCYSTAYQAKSWSKERPICIKSTNFIRLNIKKHHFF